MNKSLAESAADDLAWTLSRVRHAFRWRWMKVRGKSGEFAHPEASFRAQRLSEQWDSTWPGCVPVGYLLRSQHPERWVRFHSLPDAQRYAENATEYRELLHRHRAVLTELLAGADSSALTVIAQDWSHQDAATGQSKGHLSDAWPWKIVTDSSDAEAGPSYCWVQQGVDERGLNALLLAAADDRGTFVLAGPGMDWLDCPYDGGADVLLSSTTQRDALRERHAEWLSARSDGL